MTTGLVVLTYYYNSKLNDLQQVMIDLNAVEKDFQKAVSHQKEFLISEAVTKGFYIGGASDELEASRTYCKGIFDELDRLKSHALIKKFKIKDSITAIQHEIENYSQLSFKLESYVSAKGFYDYGLEGEFRDFIHQIEDEYDDIVPTTLLLQIRRNEKDYLLRDDVKYVEKLNLLVDSALAQINPKLSIRHKKSKYLLQSYQKKFLTYVEYDQKIGRNLSKGIRKDIYQKGNQLQVGLAQTLELFELKRKSYIVDLSVWIFLACMVYILIILLLIYSSAYIISKPLKTLSLKLKQFVKNDFSRKTIHPPFYRRDEIGLLTEDIYKLQVEISEHFKNFREDSAQREKELNEQKEKLEIQKYLLRQSRNKLHEKNLMLEDSIRYAERIQKTVFPSSDSVNQLFPNAAIKHIPSETISGDFYWIYETEKYKFFALADCTGHGVPGAFMSMLGMSFLNVAVSEKKFYKPNNILNYLNRKIAETLQQSGTESKVKDGMDIAVIRLEKETDELQYAGAQINLNVLRNGKILTINGDRHPIGWVLPGEQKEFTCFKWMLSKGDKIILFSDGLVDQFGGDRDKKFKFRRLKEVIVNHSHENTQELSDSIIRTFVNWKGTNNQTDDVCLAIFEPDFRAQQLTMERISSEARIVSI